MPSVFELSKIIFHGNLYTTDTRNMFWNFLINAKERGKWCPHKKSELDEKKQAKRELEEINIKQTLR